jgi:spore coat protein H
VIENGARDLFTHSAVCRIKIEVAPEGMERLRTEARKYVPAEITIFGRVIRNVGIHLKGTGSYRPLEDKPSFTVDFSKYVSGQHFQNVSKIHLNNSVQDATYLKEQLGSELFQAAGVPTPRVAHALVELNGRSLGLYLLKEGFTEEFLARSFSSGAGNLYDTDKGHDIDRQMKRHLGSDSSNDQVELQQLALAALEPRLDPRWEQLRQKLDMEQFLTFMAIEMMICHWDGYCLGQNNFRVYFEPRADKIRFLPSGMDQLFSKADMAWQADMSGLVARSVMEVPQGKIEYEAKFRSLFNQLFVSKQITNRVHELLARLRPFLKRQEFASIRGEALDLCTKITEREESLRQQLNCPAAPIPDFVDGVALLAGWKPFDQPEGGTMQESQSPGGDLALQIIAGPRTSASWRTTVRLKQGSYQFRGKARVIGAAPLPFGVNQGASLRAAGRGTRSAELAGTSASQVLESTFEVNAPEEEVTLICELRATAGQAWFDKNSLSLMRASR